MNLSWKQILLGVGILIVSLTGGGTILNKLTSSPSNPLPPIDPVSNPAPIAENIIIRFRVLSLDNKQSLPDALITVSSSGAAESEYTDSNGYTEFSVPGNSSKVSIVTSKDGYEVDTKNNINIESYSNGTESILLKKKSLN